jgi:hypothetical protein
MPMFATVTYVTMPGPHIKLQRVRLGWSDPMNEGVSVACRLLPELARSIMERARRDESFRDLCDDLAAAELALGKLRRSPDGASSERVAECEGWITSLTAEVENAVRRADGLKPLH